jgi:hypothetical protein
MRLFGNKLQTTLFGSCGLLLVLVVTSKVSATTVVELSLEQLVGKADTIVVATVGEQLSHWNKRGHIVTDVELEVQQTLKGYASEGEPLTVTTQGGTVGDIIMKVEGSPRFVSGATILVFLREVPSLGELRVVGMSQGIRYLYDGPYGQMILPGGEGLNLLESEYSEDSVGNAGSSHETPSSAEQLLSEVKRLVTDRFPR